MQPINITMIYYWYKKLKKILHVLKADMITIKKNIDLMSPAQRMHFLQDIVQMTNIALVSVINHYHINGLHLFWNTLYFISTNLFSESQGLHHVYPKLQINFS